MTPLAHNSNPFNQDPGGLCSKIYYEKHYGLPNSFKFNIIFHVVEQGKVPLWLDAEF